MLFACLMSKTIDAHLEYVILIAFPWHNVSRTRLNITLCVRCFSCLNTLYMHFVQKYIHKLNVPTQFHEVKLFCGTAFQISYKIVSFPQIFVRVFRIWSHNIDFNVLLFNWIPSSHTFSIYKVSVYVHAYIVDDVHANTMFSEQHSTLILSFTLLMKYLS